MKELKHIDMLIFKRNTGDVALQLLVVVVVQIMAKVMVTILSITYCSIMIIRTILTMMRMVCSYTTSFYT